MSGVLWLTWNQLRCNPGRTGILVACLAVTAFLPLVGSLLVTGYERELRSRAHGTPMVLGSKGNRFDLVLAALYFREVNIDPVPWAACDELRKADMGTAIPIHLGFTARRRPVVGTSPEYYELRGLRTAAGTIPQLIGDAVVGAKVAADLGLRVDDHVFSDPTKLYDITVPPALRLRVTGILAATGTVDDEVLFVDTKTGWVLAGLAHGHGDPKRGVDPKLVLGERGGNTVMSEALIEYNEVTADNVKDFHFHGDPATLPLSAILFVPEHAKAGTLLKARINETTDWRMLVPTEVVDELLAFVFQIKRLFDTLTVVFAAVTAAMMVLVLLLSARLRRREMQTLHRIGCSPGIVAALYGVEVAVILAAAVLVATTAAAAAVVLAPDLLAWLPRT